MEHLQLKASCGAQAYCARLKQMFAGTYQLASCGPVRYPCRYSLALGLELNLVLSHFRVQLKLFWISKEEFIKIIKLDSEG